MKQEIELPTVGGELRGQMKDVLEDFLHGRDVSPDADLGVWDFLFQNLGAADVIGVRVGFQDVMHRETKFLDVSQNFFHGLFA